MSTDASYRFERGVDPAGMRAALERCVHVILATAGGSVDGPVLDCVPVRFEPEVVPLRLARIEHVLGVPFDAATVRSLLSPLGFEVVGGKETLEVRVPGFRSYDVRREVDLIEEVARTHGYDAFPADLRAYRPTRVPDHPLFGLEDELRRALAARGLFEAHTPAFAPEGEGDVEVSNPLSVNERFMRRALLPALLRRVEHNFAQGNRDVRLFEIGTAFRKKGPGEPPHEATRVAAVLTGLRAPSHWADDDRVFDVWDLKGLAEEVARRLHGDAARVQPGSDDAALDGTHAFTIVDAAGAVIGRAGLVANGVVDAPVWAKPVWALEVELPREVTAEAAVAYRRLPSHPPIDRDLALLVPNALASDAVAAAIARHGGKLLEEVALFDVYAGEGIPGGVRSLAFRLRFRSPERTLKDTEIDRAIQQLLGRLEEELGVQPRG
jgi:phenylalanyl-tRNA synthetase beta chain